MTIRVDGPVMADLVCQQCEEVVSVFGDDEPPIDRETFRCVWCRDPRQREHDELVAAERELA